MGPERELRKHISPARRMRVRDSRLRSGKLRSENHRPPTIQRGTQDRKGRPLCVLGKYLSEGCRGRDCSCEVL